MVPAFLTGPAALVLLFVVPGFGVTCAVFPERIRPARDRNRVWLEVATVTFLTSLSVTILLGELLQAGPGFSASWGDPRLELLDLAVGVVGLGFGRARGAFRRPATAPGVPGETSAPRGGWETLRALERLTAEERSIDRRLRRASLPATERDELERRRDDLARERRKIVDQRRSEYAA